MLLRVGLVGLLVSLVAMAAPAGKFAALNAWVGKYPIDKKEKKFKDVLKVKPLQAELKKLLGSVNFKRLKNDIALVEPIKKLEGDYISIVGVGDPHIQEHVEHTLILVKMPAGPVTVGFAREGLLEWFPPETKFEELPKEAREGLERYK